MRIEFENIVRPYVKSNNKKYAYYTLKYVDYKFWVTADGGVGVLYFYSNHISTPCFKNVPPLACYNSVTLSDANQTTPFSTFCIAFHIFVVSRDERE